MELIEFTPNRTSRYLLPIINTFDATFINNFAKISSFLRITTIADVLYGDTKRPALFLLFDRNGAFNKTTFQYIDSVGNKKKFQTYLKYIRTHQYYIDDYIYGDIRGDVHCIIIQIPNAFINAYNAFNESRYSEMYTEDELKTVGILKIKNNKPNPTYQVLTKDVNYIPVFQNILNTLFTTNVVIDDNRELEFPLSYNIQTEILNHECIKEKQEP
mgnify:CR=1 FL=1